MKKLNLIIVIIFSLFAGRGMADNPKPLRLIDALRLAEAHSPELRAGQARAAEEQSNHEIVKSKIYPQIELDGIEGYGFPGSTSGLLEFGGVSGSPYRSGQSIDVTAKLKLYDWELHEELQESASNVRAAAERTKVLRSQVYSTALAAFVQASVDRGEEDAWQDIHSRVHEVDMVVRGFVRTGQHSPVQLLLVQDQRDQADLNEKVFHEKFRLDLERLAFLTGLDESKIDCASIDNIPEDETAGIRMPKKNPLVLEAEERLQAARSSVWKSRAERMPKLYGVGSYGEMAKSRLVPEQDWSAGIALRLPLFEGFRISSEVDRAKAASDERLSELQTVQLRLNEENARFDEQIRTSRLELRDLSDSLKSAVEALKIAKRRYHNYTGRLVDVREAIRNLARIETQMIAVKGELILALGQKALVNGGYVE